jgi:D-amino-acid dehydrogenase
VHARNRSTLGALAQFSRTRMDELAASLKLEFEQASGYLVLLRSHRELARAQKSLAHLADHGIPHEMIDAARCRELEPALSNETPLQGAIRLPQDGVGNCRQFAHLIKAQAQSLGANFRFGTEVSAISGASRPELASRPADSADAPVVEAFDAIVVCGGHESGRLLGPLGLHVPLLPVYGYSITAQVRHLEDGMDLGPRSGVMDERYKVTVTRLGQRVRVAGGAEIGGRPDRLDPGALRTLYKVLKDWFPGAAELARVQQWKGARPMLPDGPPVVGPSPTKGVWLNLGHGSSGWALSCGSARVLADQIAGRKVGIDVSGLALDRLR